MLVPKTTSYLRYRTYELTDLMFVLTLRSNILVLLQSVNSDTLRARPIRRRTNRGDTE